MDNWRAHWSNSLKALSLTLLVVCATISVSHAQDGQKLFKQNCASCHTITTKKLTGPGLEGVFTRVPSEEWAINWVKNSSAVIASGDAYGNKIFNEYNKTQMTPFEFLSDEEILAIFDYIKNPPKKEDKKEDDGGEEVATTNDGGTNPLPIIATIGLLFFVLIIVLSGAQKSLQTLVNEKQGLPSPQDRTFGQSIGDWVKRNKALVTVLLLITVLWGLKSAWDGMLGIGVYEGYEPEQPIAYSHKIHAGENGVACVYCHFGAEKGRAAGIPPANVCMNCHKFIDEGPSGKGEIAKIYAALDYNPETQTYGPNQKPIEWVRVHNLPDHVYFNHSQHVVVGKIECETCHGPVKDEYTVGKQFAPLTMGWCINCHRETGLQMADNGYYEDMHERYKGQFKKGETITVDKMGGLECGKCHY